MLERVSYLKFILLILGYSAVSAICSAAVIFLLPVLFKRFFDEKRWTKGKYFIFAGITALTIGVANSLFNYVVDVNFMTIDETAYLHYLYANLLTAFTVGIIPTTAGYFFGKNKLLHSILQEKEDQNRQLLFRVREENENTADEKIVTLSGNSKETLTLFPHELIYIEASGNYADIYYSLNGQISTKTIRATLLQMEEHLSDYPFIVRCHRAFIVNTYQIERIKGLKLRLKAMETEIPISKTCRNNLTG
jgi:hypothetical protein